MSVAQSVRAHHPARRWFAALVVSLAATVASMLLMLVGWIEGPTTRVNTAIYDAFYRSRAPTSCADGDVVIVAIDQSSIDRMSATESRYRFPWPRDVWAGVIRYLQSCGAAVIVFDLVFEEPSGYDRELRDDTAFAAALDGATVPVILAQNTPAPPATAPFSPPVKRPPIFGACNVIESAVVREYLPYRHSQPSVAVRAVQAVNRPLPDWSGSPFRLHYYGPTRSRDDQRTFRTVPAMALVEDSFAELGSAPQIERALFKGKVVLIGATAMGAFDLKSAPVAELFSGAEIHATAVQNLLDNLRVVPTPGWAIHQFAFFSALLAGISAIIPRRVVFKLLCGVATCAALLWVSRTAFHATPIRWIPPALPLLATLLSLIAGLGWTYLVEDRQRRFILRALSQYVSPAVAEELSRRGEISLGGTRREMTVLFSDIAGFSDIAESLSVEQLEAFMNRCLTEMSNAVLATDGTLDKYIGDAVMSFWNAPLSQPDHAQRACRTALAIVRRERELRADFHRSGLPAFHARIGINSGTVVVGNMGSTNKMNYTVMGDAVNLASRLEGANKLFGSQILVGQRTFELTTADFLFRQVDLLRVKGKSRPVAVYELIAEGAGEPAQVKLCGAFEHARTLYQSQRWDDAESAILAVLADFPDDGPSLGLLERIRHLRQHPPEPGWDGVHVAQAK